MAYYMLNKMLDHDTTTLIPATGCIMQLVNFYTYNNMWLVNLNPRLLRVWKHHAQGKSI